MIKVAVVGASNMDILARSDEMVTPGDSNIGTVRKACGGVGKNIATALKAMDFDVSMLTAVADDEYGNLILEELKSKGIGLIQGPAENSEFSTGVYCCLMDGDGSLVCAINDMKINDTISAEVVMQHKEFFESCDYLVFEANLPVETIKALTQLDVKLVADCVSSHKAEKLADCLENLYLVKANFGEACVLADLQGVEKDSDGIDEVMQALVSKGLRRAIISLGRDGAFCYELTGQGTIGFDARVLPNLNVVSTNGCGDVLLAGFMRAMSEGFPLMDALYFGQAASGINSESLQAVSPELNYENIKKKAEEYYEQIS